MDNICLHHNDVDGRAAAAIVRRAFKKEVLLHEMNYGDDVPWEDIEKAKKVIVVDFSLPPDEMKRLAAGRELTWIDHHKTSLEALEDLAVKWPGIRNLNEAACVLTWQHFFPEEPIPRSVVLIGDRDIWRWAEPETGTFGEGIFQKDTRPENDSLWEPLLDDNSRAINQLIKTGSILRKARLKDIERKVSVYGMEGIFEGYRTLVINARGSGEMGQLIRDVGYKIAYCYNDNLQNDTLTTFVTLYSDEVDVSEIARKFGGGGHPGAAGFSFPRKATPFPDNSEFSFITKV